MELVLCQGTGHAPTPLQNMAAIAVPEVVPTQNMSLATQATAHVMVTGDPGAAIPSARKPVVAAIKLATDHVTIRHLPTEAIVAMEAAAILPPAILIRVQWTEDFQVGQVGRHVLAHASSVSSIEPGRALRLHQHMVGKVVAAH